MTNVLAKIKFAKNYIILLISLSKNIIIITAISAIIRPVKKKVVLICLTEHLGDIIACEPIGRYIRKQHPADFIIWITKYRYEEVIRYNRYLSLTLGVASLYEWILIKKLCNTYKIFDIHINYRGCSIFNNYLLNPNKHNITHDNYYFFGSLIEIFSLAGGLPKLSDQPIFHFNPNLKPKHVPHDSYIVIHCKSNDDTRDWDNEKWNHLVDKLTSAGHIIIEVGYSAVTLSKNSNYKNYCGKLSLQEIAHLISGAKLFIGIDSSFAHIANATYTPGVILLGRHKTFKKYTPYSGFYSDPVSGSHLFHHKRLAKNIPVKNVYNAAVDILNRKPKEQCVWENKLKKISNFSLRRETYYVNPPPIMRDLILSMEEGGNKYSYKFDKCSDVLHCNPIPKEDELIKWYHNNFNYDWYKKRKIFKILQSYDRWRLIKRLITKTAGPQKLLDIGCGHGWLLDHAHRDGYETEGVDYPSPATKYSLEHNKKIYEMDVMGMNFKNRYSIITMWHALEHVRDPNAVLLKIKELLREDGTLVLAVPNLRADGVFIRNVGWVWIQQPFVHLHHWSYKSLANLLESNGFIVDKIITRDTWDANSLYDGYIGPNFEPIINKLFSQSLSFVIIESARVAAYAAMRLNNILRRNNKSLNKSELIIFARNTT